MGKRIKFLLIFLFIFQISSVATAQGLPHDSENIDYISTFCNQTDKSFGDDDYTQTFFLVLPKTLNEPFFIRIFDPDVGGDIDEVKDNVSKTKFSVFGGKSCFSDPDARNIDPVGNFKSGILLTSKIFDCFSQYDGKWFVFGPFNPKEGELIKEMDGFVFKLTTEGLSGRNGNLYRYFISSHHDNNNPVEGANAFTYKYTFRLVSKENSIAFLYPFINKDVVSLKIHSFDFDNDGDIVLYSVKKNRQKVKHSNDNQWSESIHYIQEEEKNTSLSIQIVKKDNKKNDMGLYVTNQFDKPVPFYAIPIGGPPKYRYKVNINYYSK